MEEVKPKREFLATVYIIKDNKVLLNQNIKLHKFIPVGGHLEENELPHECALREAKEETGFDIELIDLGALNVRNLPPIFDIGLDIIKPDHHHINISYIGKIISGEQLAVTDEGGELRWFSAEELKDLDTFDNVKQAAIKALEIINSTS